MNFTSKDKIVCESVQDLNQDFNRNFNGLDWFRIDSNEKLNIECEKLKLSDSIIKYSCPFTIEQSLESGIKDFKCCNSLDNVISYCQSIKIIDV